MSKGMSLLEMLQKAAEANRITKKEFGLIMHSPDSTEEQIADALRQLNEADGYENLPD